MRIATTTLLACSLITGFLNAVAAAPVELMPGVSEVEWGQAAVVEGGGVVVLSDQTSPLEREAARLGDAASIWTGDVCSIAKPSAFYDAVFDFGIVHHVPAWRQALSETR